MILSTVLIELLRGLDLGIGEMDIEVRHGRCQELAGFWDRRSRMTIHSSLIVYDTTADSTT